MSYPSSFSAIPSMFLEIKFIVGTTEIIISVEADAASIAASHKNKRGSKNDPRSVKATLAKESHAPVVKSFTEFFFLSEAQINTSKVKRATNDPLAKYTDQIQAFALKYKAVYYFI